MTFKLKVESLTVVHTITRHATNECRGWVKIVIWLKLFH